MGLRRVWRSGGLLFALLLLLGGCGGLNQEEEPNEVVAPPPTPQERPTQVATSGEGGQTQPAVKPLAGFLAPDLTATDVRTGKQVSLADLKGQVVMLNFWATWCPPCKEEMPAMENFHQEMGEQVRVLALGADGKESVEKLVAYADAMELTFAIGHDRGRAAATYRVSGVPTSFFIDANGVIRTRYTGPLTLEQMKQYLERAQAAVEADGAAESGGTAQPGGTAEPGGTSEPGKAEGSPATTKDPVTK